MQTGRPSARGELELILEHAYGRDWTVGELVQASGRSRQTCKFHLDGLVAEGVMRVRKFRGKDLYWRVDE